ncbi:MAG TPA: hypothetical protein VMU37_06035, partial [Caulobacteraceae bacterium]|nr:hypothetical protein [Caulobacteraceae bacterium]
MQVFGLRAAVYRGASWASRLAAQTSDIAAARRDALRRFERARRDGLSAAQAAKAVGVSRASLHRWSKRLEPKSRRPHRVRPKRWTSRLVRAVQALRDDFPMWGKAKLGPLLRSEGWTCSDATVGRILKRLMQRGVVQPVPRLRKRPHARWSAKRKHAVRLPKGFRSDRPGGVVQIDTVFINLAPGKAIKHFTAY